MENLICKRPNLTNYSSASILPSILPGMNLRQHRINEILDCFSTTKKGGDNDFGSGTAPTTPNLSPQNFRREDKRRASLAIRRQSNANVGFFFIF